MLCHLFNMFKQFSLFAKEITAFEQNDNDNDDDSVFSNKSLKNNKFSIHSANKLSVDYSKYDLLIDEYLLFSTLSILIHYFHSIDTTTTKNSALVQLKYTDYRYLLDMNRVYINTHVYHSL